MRHPKENSVPHKHGGAEGSTGEALTKGRLLFVNKKKQKRLYYLLGHCRYRRHSLRPSLSKVFAPLFSKSGHSPSS
jgi:hypothetical protein